MQSDKIVQIGLDEKGRLYVKPDSSKFPFIYREAMEVQWNSEKEILYGTELREGKWNWKYIDWYKQIIAAAHVQGIELQITEKTEWLNIPHSLQNEIKLFKHK